MFLSRLNDFQVPPDKANNASGTGCPLKISQRAFETLAGFADFALIVLAAAAGGMAVRQLYLGSDAAAAAGLGAGIVAGFFFVWAAKAEGLYRFPFLLAPFRSFGRIVPLCAAIALLTGAAGLILARTFMGPAWLLAAAVLPPIAAVPISRWLFAKVARFLLRRGNLDGRRVVTIGESAGLPGLSTSDLLHRFGLKEVFRVAVPNTGARRGRDVLAALERGAVAARELGAEELLVALHWHDNGHAEEISTRLGESSLSARLVPARKIGAILRRQDVRDLRDLGLDTIGAALNVQRPELTAFEKLAKRTLDILFSATALVVLLPIFLIAAAAIKLDSKGPVIFRQRRSGLDAQEFVILKFRTMKVLEDGPAIKQASRGDQRVTRVGKFLRRSSIDELPQFLNVLAGDMSLVGPRPHAVAHDNEYKDLIADYGLRHRVKPGMTGWAQVNGLRGETRSLQQMAERVQRDLWYIRNWSLSLDIEILFRTCFEIMRDRAY